MQYKLLKTVVPSCEVQCTLVSKLGEPGILKYVCLN